jgi:MFS superfamily sulfate permease-like transporter
VDHLDHSVVEAMHDWKQNYEKDGGKVIKASLVDLWKDLKTPEVNRRKPKPKYFKPQEHSISEISL